MLDGAVLRQRNLPGSLRFARRRLNNATSFVLPLAALVKTPLHTRYVICGTPVPNCGNCNQAEAAQD